MPVECSLGATLACTGVVVGDTLCERGAEHREAGVDEETDLVAREIRREDGGETDTGEGAEDSAEVCASGRCARLTVGAQAD